jgi:hypothetical protein
MKRAALVAVVVSGCSWTFSRAPERGRPCKANVVAPAIDTYEALGAGAIALASLKYVNEGHSDGDVIALVGAVSAGLSLLYAASAKHGFDRAAACKQADLYRP